MQKLSKNKNPIYLNLTKHYTQINKARLCKPRAQGEVSNIIKLLIHF